MSIHRSGNTGDRALDKIVERIEKLERLVRGTGQDLRITSDALGWRGTVAGLQTGSCGAQDQVTVASVDVVIPQGGGTLWVGCPVVVSSIINVTAFEVGVTFFFKLDGTPVASISGAGGITSADVSFTDDRSGFAQAILSPDVGSHTVDVIAAGTREPGQDGDFSVYAWNVAALWNAGPLGVNT